MGTQGRRGQHPCFCTPPDSASLARVPGCLAAGLPACPNDRSPDELEQVQQQAKRSCYRLMDTLQSHRKGACARACVFGLAPEVDCVPCGRGLFCRVCSLLVRVRVCGRVFFQLSFRFVLIHMACAYLATGRGGDRRRLEELSHKFEEQLSAFTQLSQRVAKR